MSNCIPCGGGYKPPVKSVYKSIGDGCVVVPVANQPSLPINSCSDDSFSTSTYIPLASTQNECTPVKSCEKQWLDIGLFNDYKFGYRWPEQSAGSEAVLSTIPQWAIGWCFEETPLNSPGRLLTDCFRIKGLEGVYKRYIKTKANGDVFIYVKEITTGEEHSEGEYNALIPNCAIKDLDANKLFNICSIFEKSAKPVSNFYDPLTGSLPSNIAVLPVIYSKVADECKLSVLFDCKIARACVIPVLKTSKGPLWDYNPDDGALPVFKPENLDCLVNVCIDGETVRAANRGGAGTPGETKGGAGDRPNGKILTSYTYVNPEYLTGDGSKNSPIDVKDNSLDIKVIKKCDNLNPGFTDFTNFYFTTSWSFYDGAQRWSQGGNIGGTFNMDISGTDTTRINPDFDPGNQRSTPSLSGEKNFSFRVPETGCSNKVWFGEVTFLYKQLGKTRQGAESNNYRAGINSLTNMRLLPENADRSTFYANFVDETVDIDGTGMSGGGSTFITMESGTTVSGKIFNECIFPNDFTNLSNDRRYLGFCILSVKILGQINRLVN